MRLSILFYIFILSSCISCGRISSLSLLSSQVKCSTYQTTSIAPLYSMNGLNWNDYIKNDGANRYNATEIVCVGNEAGGYQNGCLHGGGMRVATIVGETSCSGITAVDELGVFKWVCDDSSGVVKIISDGINSGKGLASQIDFDDLSWKKNLVVVSRDSCILASSPSADWGWTNPINDVTVSATLNSEGEIYVVRNDITASVEYSSHKVGFVVKPGVVLTAEAASSAAVFTSNTLFFLWIEGEFDANGETRGIFLNDTGHSVLRNIKTYGGASHGIEIRNGANHFGDNIESYNNTSVGLIFNNNSNSYFTNLSLYKNSIGIDLDDFGGDCTGSRFINLTAINNNIALDTCAACHDNIFHKLFLANNTNAGINTRSNIVVSQVVLLNNSGSLVSCYQDSDDHFSHMTLLNGGSHGLVLNTCSNTTLSQSVISNVVGDAIPLWNDSDGNIFSNIVLTDNGDQGVAAGATEENSIVQEIFKAGNNVGADCGFPGTGNQLDGTCTPINGGTAIVTTGVSIANSIVGKVTSDSNNSSDSSGSSLYDSIIDWFDFDNWFRGWGQDHTDSFPSANHRTACITAESCRIWDVTLRSTDSVLRNVISCPDGDNTLTHTWNVAGAETHLNHAIEMMGDGVGDDDLLCESNETCLYTPNIGAYQGHGALVDSSCSEISGVVSNVILKQYSINGR